MIGNDIVDLQAAGEESCWQRSGWLNKVLAPSEQVMIENGPEAGTMVWLLWSMKEAAYKLYYRNGGPALLAPARWQCTIWNLSGGAAEGIVREGHICYYTRSLITPAFIHTTATLHSGRDKPSIYINNAEISRPYLRDSFFFKDSRGVPYLACKASGNVKPVSYSHHGRYEALAFFGNLHAAGLQGQ